MQHTDLVYNFVLMPLVCFGGFSVMLAFVVMLPGVGNLLAALWTLLTADWFFQKRKGTDPLTPEEQNA